MGFWSRLVGIDSYDAAQRALPEPYEPYFATAGIPVMDPGTPLEVWTRGERSEIERFWRTQPNVRKVVDFIARNVAGIPLHVFERESDTQRRRISDEPLSVVLKTPRVGVGAYRFWHAVLSDGLLYDRWCVLVHEGVDGLELVQVPSWRLKFDTDALRRVTAIRYWQGDDSSREPWTKIDMSHAIYDHGYAPATAGLSPIATLRDILDESAEAVAYRRQVWENGGRFHEYVHRPETAAQWDPDQRDRWTAAFKSYLNNGSKAGGMPLMEDGMKIMSSEGFTPQDAQDLEGRRLTAIETAAAFHIAPELVGAQQGNYSNVREYRQMLYRDSLGPYIQSLEGAINSQLVPRLNAGRAIYVEANVESKLRGSFEEQADVTTKATGAPWMTINEARALRNMPPVDGGDVPVQPLNLIYGGQMPSEAGTQNDAPKGWRKVHEPDAIRRKAAVSARQREQIASVLGSFFARQGKAVLSRIGASENWWDGERWDAELADDLHRTMHTLAALLGDAEAERLGFEGGYNSDLTVNFLRAVAERYAGNINETTRTQVETAVASEEPPADVFTAASEGRASGIASGVGAFVAGFATVEAGKQVREREGVRVTKTWHTGSNPRDEHAALDGQTVDIDDTFSNGMDWPGSGGGANDIGCNCTVSTNSQEA